MLLIGNQFSGVMSVLWVGAHVGKCRQATRRIVHPYAGTLLARLQVTWASMVYHGEEGYTQNCKKIVDVARKLADGMNPCDHFIESDRGKSGSELDRCCTALKVAGIVASLCQVFKSLFLSICRYPQD